ncbi:30S ribosome-binding factor RbfA [Pelagibacterium xiamenense]|uniref:30S ribosome-binding factor RbfA n=1 Tax=Pelagibacterium xiamenense TaxID=2901140 RepID=UPI001E29397F|nr:30S ribosome-binding factor RbfA [Pelagibacterium xiamenense]MCD7058549.1 30S ribosome-binding factor RbfA [Pelagibacterium xiamenense]
MAKRSKTSAPSQRMLRVGELVRHEIAALLSRGEIIDDLLETVTVTVPEVRMTPDLKIANVYVMPLGGENAEDVADALNAHARFIRGRVTPALDLKYAPEFRFFVDKTFDEFGKIDALLKSERVQRDLGPRDDEENDQ